MRSGTLNVTGIIGLGKACELCQQEMAQETAKLSRLRDRLKEGIMSKLDECYINGSMEHRLPHNINISFAFVEGESLLMGINDIAVSSGSACTSATLEPSYVLKALGVGEDLSPHLDPLRHRPLQHRRRSRLRSRPRSRNGKSPARTFAALRNGQRRRRHQQNEVDRSRRVIRRMVFARWHPEPAFGEGSQRYAVGDRIRNEPRKSSHLKY